jgi:hypothetical protein
MKQARGIANNRLQTPIPQLDQSAAIRLVYF